LTNFREKIEVLDLSGSIEHSGEFLSSCDSDLWSFNRVFSHLAWLEEFLPNFFYETLRNKMVGEALTGARRKILGEYEPLSRD